MTAFYRRTYFAEPKVKVYSELPLFRTKTAAHDVPPSFFGRAVWELSNARMRVSGPKPQNTIPTPEKACMHLVDVLNGLTRCSSTNGFAGPSFLAKPVKTVNRESKRASSNASFEKAASSFNSNRPDPA